MSFEILFPIFLFIAIGIRVLFKEGAISIKDCQIFLKTKRYPKWECLGEKRMIVKKKVGDYYKLIEQVLYTNLNDEKGKPEWRTNYRSGFGANIGPYVLEKLVAKDSVTIDEEGVAHYVTAKDPIEI